MSRGEAGLCQVAGLLSLCVCEFELMHHVYRHAQTYVAPARLYPQPWEGSMMLVTLPT